MQTEVDRKSHECFGGPSVHQLGLEMAKEAELYRRLAEALS